MLEEHITLQDYPQLEKVLQKQLEKVINNKLYFFNYYEECDFSGIET